MLELFKMGYSVVVGSPYGDLVIKTEWQCEVYGDAKLEERDDEAKTAYFYDPIW